MQQKQRGFNPRTWMMLWAALLGGFLLAGCDMSKTTGQRMSVATPEVSVVQVKTQQVLLTSELPGRTSAYLVSEIRPQVSGIIHKRLFTEGADVKAGQLLYQIDPAPFQAAFDNAKANLLAARKAADKARAALGASIADVTRQQATLNLAQINQKRFEDLYKDKAVSALERDKAITDAQVAAAALDVSEAQVKSYREAVATADAAIEQAQAVLETAQINLDYTKITAPISGRIGKSNVTQGALVTAYQPLTLSTIQQMDPIYVDVPQSTTELLRLRRLLESGQINEDGENHQKIQLVLEDGSSYPLEGTLQFRDISVDPTTGSFILRMIFPNPDGLLLPGMFVRAVIKEGMKKEAILIPQQTVSRDPKGNPYVMVLDETSKVQNRSITIDRAIKDQWLVSKGLVPGEQIVIEGLQRLRPGTAVKVVSYSGDQSQSGESKAPVSSATQSN